MTKRLQTFSLIFLTVIAFIFTSGVYAAIATPTPNCTNKIQGDANCDTVITIEDFNIWKDQYLGNANLTSENSYSTDFDQDGSYTINDFEIWRRNFNFADPQPGNDIIIPPTNTPTPVPPTNTPTPRLVIVVTPTPSLSTATTCYWCGLQCVAKDPRITFMCPDVMHPPDLSCILDKTTNTCTTVPSDDSVELR
jgi:hypothetical protein